MSPDAPWRPDPAACVTHVNHASLLVSDGEEHLVTDPWYVSPAIGFWTQHPAPPASLVEGIFAIPSEHLAVLVSHGHDDHLDDFVLRHHFSESSMLIPDFGDPALRNRLVRATGRADILQIGDAPCSAGPFTVSRFVNDHFTGHDAIMVIETPSLSLIHANDNWHAQSETTLRTILEVTHPGKPVIFCTQIGIADAYPWSYPQIDPDEATAIVENRIDRQCAAAASNALILGMPEVFVYANESRIGQPGSFASLDTGGLTAGRLDYFNRSSETGVQLHQLRSGSWFDRQGAVHAGNPSLGSTLLERLIQGLEDRFNDHLTAPGREAQRGQQKCRFVLLGSNGAAGDGSHGPGTVIYAADPVCWQNILTGHLTLEAISIGGGGRILTAPKGLDIRDTHHEMSKFAYKAQRELSTNGLGWLLT